MRHLKKDRNKIHVVWTVMFDVYPVDNNQDLIIRNAFLDGDFLTKKEFKFINKIVTKHHDKINYGIRNPKMNDLIED